MILKNLLSLLALRDRIVIVDDNNDGLYEGVVEDVPCDLVYLPVEDSGVDVGGGWARVCL